MESLVRDAIRLACCCYRKDELYRLRRESRHARRPEAKVLDVLAAAGILHYRGQRAGRDTQRRIAARLGTGPDIYARSVEDGGAGEVSAAVISTTPADAPCVQAYVCVCMWNVECTLSTEQGGRSVRPDAP